VREAESYAWAQPTSTASGHQSLPIPDLERLDADGKLNDPSDYLYVKSGPLRAASSRGEEKTSGKVLQETDSLNEISREMSRLKEENRSQCLLPLWLP
jgi:hypothetical protein